MLTQRKKQVYFLWSRQTLLGISCLLSCPAVLPPDPVSDGRDLFFSSFSVGQPFQGAYLEINKNPKYKKLKDAIDEKIIIAEVVNKINRANGKVNAPPAGCGPRLSAGTASVVIRMLKLAFHIPSRVAVRGVVSPCLPGSEALYLWMECL